MPGDRQNPNQLTEPVGSGLVYRTKPDAGGQPAGAVNSERTGSTWPGPFATGSPLRGAITTHDPGWEPAIRSLPWTLLPIVGRARIRARGDGLLFLRSFCLSMIPTVLLLFVAFTFIAPFDGGDEGRVPAIVVAAGMFSVVGTLWIKRRPLNTSSADALGRSYAATVTIGTGLATAAALWGIVGIFLSGSLWLYFVGVPFFALALWMSAPTRADIERRQRDLTASGSNLSLLDAVISLPPPTKR